MDILQKRREQISALTDSEWSGCAANARLDALDGNEAKSTWLLYHQVGDTLRSVDQALPVSDAFQRRFSERFSSEPVHIRPAGSVERISSMRVTEARSKSSGNLGKRAGFAGLAAAAAAVAAFFGAPALMLSDATSPTESVDRIDPVISAATRDAKAILLDTDAVRTSIQMPLSGKELKGESVDSHPAGSLAGEPAASALIQASTQPTAVSRAASLPTPPGR